MKILELDSRLRGTDSVNYSPYSPEREWRSPWVMSWCHPRADGDPCPWSFEDRRTDFTHRL